MCVSQYSKHLGCFTFTIKLYSWYKNDIALYFYQGYHTTRMFQYITDDQFARPINEVVRLMSNYAKVYYYRFSYVGRLGLAAGESERSAAGNLLIFQFI